MVNLAFTVYEVRESTLRDLGIDYLAWRNGPGLNLLQAGFNAMSLDSAGSAALSAASGGFGAFFIAPQFDASFIRMLQQNGKATIANTAASRCRTVKARVTRSAFPRSLRRFSSETTTSFRSASPVSA